MGSERSVPNVHSRSKRERERIMERIKFLKEEYGLSNSVVAERLGLSRNYVSMMYMKACKKGKAA